MSDNFFSILIRPRQIGSGLVATLLVACTGPYYEVALNPAALQNVKVIALVGPDDPAYQISVEGQVLDEALEGAVYGGAGSGLTGAMAFTSSAQQNLKSTSAPLNVAAMKAQVRFGAELQDALVTALEMRGYKTVRVSERRPSYREFASAYSSVPDSADLILDTLVLPNVSNLGYPRFHPSVTVYARLMNRRDHKILMVHRYVYGNSEHSDARADQKYEYESYELLISDPARAIEGLRAGEKPLAELISNALKP